MGLSDLFKRQAEQSDRAEPIRNTDYSLDAAVDRMTEGPFLTKEELEAKFARGWRYNADEEHPYGGG